MDGTDRLQRTKACYKRRKREWPKVGSAMERQPPGEASLCALTAHAFLPGIFASASNGYPGHWCCDGPPSQHGSDPTLQEWALVAAAAIGSSPPFASAPGSARSACVWPPASNHLEPLLTDKRHFAQKLLVLAQRSSDFPNHLAIRWHNTSHA